jgi:hypothetical protein
MYVFDTIYLCLQEKDPDRLARISSQKVLTRPIKVIGNNDEIYKKSIQDELGKAHEK